MLKWADASKSTLKFGCPNEKVKFAQSCPTLYSPWNSPGQNIGVGSLSLLQGIFPTQGPNAGLWHCRQILYQLSHTGNSRILEWVAYPFSSGSSWARSRTRVSCIAGKFFTNWATREAPLERNLCLNVHFLNSCNCRVSTEEVEWKYYTGLLHF